MPTAESSVRLPCTPEEAWARIGDPFALHTWHPTIDAVVQDDPGIRTVTTADGRVVRERLVGQEPLAYTYAPADPGVGLPGYRATLRADEDGGAGTVVTWTGTFELEGDRVAAEVARLEGFYRRGLDALLV